MIFRRRQRALSAPRVTAWSGGVGAGILAALVALSACSDSSAAPEVTVVAAATSTTFRTEPVRTTTTTVAPPPEADRAEPDEPSGDVSAGDPSAEQTYRIRGGDYLVGIARQFGVTAEAIVAYNGWESLQHSLQPGNDIRIPPRDWTPEDTAPGTADGDPASSAGDADGDCPDGSAQQTYKIRAGDVKGTVARRFGVTVAELDAANAGTPYYAGFVIGIEIVIPC